MPRFNALTEADRQNAYPGESGDTTALFAASAALDQEVLGIDRAFATAPNMAPLGYPFTARWEGADGTTYQRIGATSVGAQPGTRTKEVVQWELFLGVGPGAGDRAQLQTQAQPWKRLLVRAYTRNTTLGARTDTAQVQAGQAQPAPVSHETEVLSTRWARLPWGKTGDGVPLHHYGWLFSLKSEAIFTAVRG